MIYSFIPSKCYLLQDGYEHNRILNAPGRICQHCLSPGILPKEPNMASVRNIPYMMWSPSYDLNRIALSGQSYM